MRLAVAITAVLLALPALAETRPFTPDELLQTRRLDDVQVAPDGKRLAFTVRQKRLDENRDARDVWVMDLPAGAPRQFTRDGHSDHARFSPDGKHLLVTSDRINGEGQLFLYDLDAGGDGRKLTSLHNGASDGVFSPDGRLIGFVSEVNPACAGNFEAAEACLKKRAEDRTKSKLRAHVTDRLLFRHWNEWRENKRSHVFVMTVDGGTPRDLTPGDADWPTFRLGGAVDLTFSRDGRFVYVSHKVADGEAWKTNSDIYAVPTEGGPARPVTDNPGDDAGPVVSPDGQWLAWKAQAQPGSEGDDWKLRVMNLGSGKVVPLALDGEPGTVRWRPDSSGLVVEVDHHARIYLQNVFLDGKVTAAGEEPAGGDFGVAPDGTIYTVVSGLVKPPELFRLPPGGKLQRISNFNTEQYAGLALGTLDEQWVTGSDGAKIHSLIVKPAGLAKGARAPLLVLIHGGPQGAWEDQWSMRWNAAAFAARGYVVVMPNPRGSSTYDSKLKEQVSKDWGGLAYEDILRSVDAAEQRPDVEQGRTCAAGASYGGYMVNWIAGHTDRFRCLVSHAGVFDLVSEYGSTEELWFPEWEFAGAYWDNPEHYRKFSPSSYVKAFKTPTLVTMGELDFRVPMEQPFGMFTALQRRGVESRLLDFPDEGHWINKPRNSQLWYRTVLDWIDAHARKAGKSQPAAAR